MTRTSIAIALMATAATFAAAAPAEAQLNHMNMPGMQMPRMKMPAAKKAPAKKKPAAKKPAPKKASAKKPAAKKAAVKKPVAKKPAAKPVDPHAGHDMGAMPGMDMPAGHDMSTMPGMEMPGHDMSAMESAAPAGTDLPAGSAPPPPLPADHAGDAVYGSQAMNMGRHHLNRFHGGQSYSTFQMNVLEAQARKGPNGFEWDGEASFGGDINRLWLKSEGDGAFGRKIDRAEAQALYSRAVGPYFNVQGGLRYDFRPDPSRVYATIGVEGLAPRFFEVEGALFLSNKGELMGRLEGYYDQRITQRLILQPRAELNLAAQNSPEIGVGKGLSNAELGLRLRYDIRREFAPYIGVQYHRAFGDTRRFLRTDGEDAGGWSLLSGVRLSF
jgi:copper resistance protein B